MDNSSIKVYDRRGFDENGIHKETGTKYDLEGYTRSGYNRQGYNREGYSKKRI